MENQLPIIESTNDKTVIDTYESLGVMLMLDLQHYLGETELSMGDYYQKKLTPINKQTAFIALNQDKRPIGYITWNTNKTSKKAKSITYQNAPFGDYTLLFNILQAQAPFRNTTSINSTNLDSARKKQKVW